MKNVPFRLTDSTSSSCVGVISSSVAAGKMPALQQTTSIPPCRSRAAATTAAQLPGSLTSPAAKETAPPPAAVSSSAVCWPAPGSRPVMTTRAPSAANPAAMPLPMPLVPPVTRTDLPLIDVNITTPLCSGLAGLRACWSGGSGSGLTGRGLTCQGPYWWGLGGSEQVPLGQLARAAGEVGSQLAGRVREPVRANPGNKLKPPQQHEGGDLRRVLGRQRQDATVTAQPGIAQRGYPRIMLDEAQRGADVEEEPAEPAVVEVDHLNIGPAHQQVGQPHVGVNQAEAVRPCAEPAQPLADQRGRAAQRLQLLLAHPDAVLPPAPAGRVADAAVEIPGEADELRRPGPSAGVAVHPRADPAEQLELLGQLILRRLGARQPLEEHRLAGHRPDRDVHHVAAIGRAGHGRGQQPLVPPQRLQPGQLGRDGAGLVIAGPVHPQHGDAPVPRVVDPVSSVLRQAEQRQPRLPGEPEGLQRGPGERVVAEQDLLRRFRRAPFRRAHFRRARFRCANRLRGASSPGAALPCAGFRRFRGAHCLRPLMPASSRSILSLATLTPSVLPATYTRPDAPIMVTSTSVFSGAACSASLAATAANSAGAGSSIDACRDRLITTACWSVTSSITSLYSSLGCSWSSAECPMPSRMARPARPRSSASRECTSSTPNWRSTNRMPGSADGAARSARSVTRSMARPGATSTMRAWSPSIGGYPRALVGVPR